MEDRRERDAGFSPAEYTGPDRRASAYVPTWLAAVVLVLLLGIFAVGGYLLRAASAGDGAPESGAISVSIAAKKVEQSPDDPAARLALGFEYQKASRFEDALREYERVLEDQPRNTGALYNKAVVLRQLGDEEQAIETLWDVLEVEPDHAMAAKSLGELYADRSQYKSLLVAVEPALASNPSMADLHYLAAVAYENLDRRQEAAQQYRDALRYNPDLTQARQALNRLGVQ